MNCKQKLLSNKENGYSTPSLFVKQIHPCAYKNIIVCDWEFSALIFPYFTVLYLSMLQIPWKQI